MTIFLLLVCSIAAFAKDKPKIIIEVIKTEMNSREYTYTTPGRDGRSETNCNTNGSTNGTISDYGVGPIQTHSTDNASTNCTTATTAATPPQTHVGTVTAEFVTAILPDGSRVFLSCEYGVHRCDVLAPGKYTAEIDGNTLQVYVSDLSGKIRKIKYKAIGRIPNFQSQQPVSATPAPLPAIKPSETINSTLPDQSVEQLKEQADNGDSNAQLLLADRYIGGNGVPKDYAKAFWLLRKAAEQGNIKGQEALGMIYGSDELIPHDYQQSAAWWRKAADQGDAVAQRNLGYLFKDGQGVAQDFTEAAVWWLKAAYQGDATAQYNLGALYFNGQGVPKDYAESYFWYDLAVSEEQREIKLEEVARYRDDSASHLTNTVLQQTQERARKWLEDHPSKPQ
ncbi:MAG: tetratricopeptide repeat protein [Formivibrio sp.]|nr:tetratricopeptide repeat protein [Formivibrio sp.]